LPAAGLRPRFSDCSATSPTRSDPCTS
jgi:hypothetical protein